MTSSCVIGAWRHDTYTCQHGELSLHYWFKLCLDASLAQLINYTSDELLSRRRRWASISNFNQITNIFYQEYAFESVIWKTSDILSRPECVVNGCNQLKLTRDDGLWWRNQNISALLSLCEGNASVTDGFPSQRLVARRFDVFFDLCLNKWCRWFETPSHSSWRHSNDNKTTWGHSLESVICPLARTR